MPPTSLARATALFAVLAFAASGRSQDPIPLPLPSAKPEHKVETPDSRVTIVEKGPIHEGFAQPGAPVRGKGITAPKAPPLPVDEVPPIAKPDGGKAQWIAGYWQWDTDRNDFIWVCGVYRNAPPERTWEPGHWAEVSKVWTYFPGYWRPTNIKALPADLPEPPAPKEDGPSGPNENPDAMWVPGLWEYKGGKYEWQPGYWPPSAGNMVWQPAQYVATETGFAFVPGFWDYLLEERGLLYSPMYFSPAQREKRDWAYRPEYAISFGSNTNLGQGGAFNSLYIGPRFNCYHYGDYSWSGLSGSLSNCGFPQWALFSYFAAPLLNLCGAGPYQPWCSTAPGYTNPLWQHYVRLNRSDAGWSKGVSAAFVSGTAYTPSGFVAAATVVRPNRVTNTFAYIQPATQVLSRQSTRVVSTDGGFTQQLVTKNTTAYQHVTRHGNVKTGVMQTWTVTPPVYNGSGKRR